MEQFDDRKSLWHICRHCDNCNGISLEDDSNWYVSAGCKLANKDIINDHTFLECPISKWKIEGDKINE